jgi:hypothetical protein
MSNTIFTSRFPKWAAITIIVVAWCATFLYQYKATRKAQCSTTNMAADLALASPTRGEAVVCAAEAAPENLVALVPQLLALLEDDSKTTSSYGTVSGRAWDALRKATPDSANVEPIVTSMVGFANRVEPRNSKSGKWEDSPSRVVRALLDLLGEKYVTAGFKQQIAGALATHSGEITNDNFWRIHENAFLNYPFGTTASRIDYLAEGKSLAAKTFMAKFDEEQKAELAKPPRIKALPMLPVPTESESASKPSGGESAIEKRVGSAGHLREDEARATKGWVTIWRTDLLAKLNSCTDTLPLMCIAKPAPDSVPMTWEQMGKLGIFSGAVDARVGLTAPVQGTQLTSMRAADAMCKKQLGEEWRLAYQEDSKAENVSPEDWWLTTYDYKKGGVITARASNEAAFKGTLYWFATQSSESNCWN